MSNPELGSFKRQSNLQQLRGTGDPGLPRPSDRRQSQGEQVLLAAGLSQRQCFMELSPLTRHGAGFGYLVYGDSYGEAMAIAISPCAVPFQAFQGFAGIKIALFFTKVGLTAARVGLSLALCTVQDMSDPPAHCGGFLAVPRNCARLPSEEKSVTCCNVKYTEPLFSY